MAPASGTAKRRRFLLLHNTNAGPEGRTLAADVERELIRAGAHVARTPTYYDLVRDGAAAHAGEFDAIISAGGDGTIRAAAKLLAGTGIPLGIVPHGTGNVFAHELGLPRSAVELAEMLMNAPVRTLTGATANGQPFFLMAGVGFDGEVVRRLDFKTKRRLGKAAYIGPVLKSLRHAPPQIECRLDGKLHTANWVIVTNARHYGGSFHLTNAASITKDGLVAVLMKGSGALSIVRHLITLGLGRMDKSSNVEIVPVRNAVISSAVPAAAEIDGDEAGTTPLEIHWGAPRIEVIVPQ